MADPAIPAQPVDQPEVEDDVGAEPDHRDHERGPGVLQPAQQPGRAEDHEHPGMPMAEIRR